MKITKKIFIIGTILLFIGMSISSSTGFNTVEQLNTIVSNGKTLYVGGSGPGNYSKIQDAINDSSDGDTVYVYNDSSPYYENLFIFNSIRLIGEDRNTTVLDGSKSGTVILVFHTDWVNISGFTIQYGFSGIDLHSSNSSVFMNTIIHNSVGIDLYFNNCSFMGCYNNIVGNSITNNNYGIQIASSNHNIISINNISSNNERGLYVHSSSSYNTAKHNKIISNKRFGICLGSYTSNNDIIGNIINSNNNYGIYLNSCFKNTIKNNSIKSNNWHGIYIHGANNNIISDNNVSSNNYDGIILGWASARNTISNNTISSNNWTGLKLLESRNNTIMGNNVSNNGNGIHIRYWRSNNSIIYHNNFIHNTQNAHDECNNTWDNGYPSGGNFWDDYKGNDSDGDGIGDTPYPIPGGDNEDRYPLMELWKSGTPYAKFTWKPSHPKPRKNIFFNASKSYDQDGFIILYEWDWNNDGEFDENHTIPTTTYSWSTGGRYPVTLRVTDNSSKTGQKTRTLIVNTPPNTPTIDGPKSGKKGIEYNYTFNATDPDEDNIMYFVDWGDGDTVGTSYNPSGKAVTLKHSWWEKGVYIIRCKTIDIYGNESDWEEFEITMPKNYNVLFSQWFDRFPLLNKLITRIMERWSK